MSVLIRAGILALGAVLLIPSGSARGEAAPQETLLLVVEAPSAKETITVLRDGDAQEEDFETYLTQVVLSEMPADFATEALKAQTAVTNMTNDLLKKNAEALKLGTIETAKESQRGIVDIETLQQTNKSLIETLDELNKIQTEGRAKRAAAEQELNRIEDELKAKMMEIRS